MNLFPHEEQAEVGDPHLNYCLWPYTPQTSSQGQLRSVSLLNKCFALAAVEETGRELTDSISQALGKFKTVWGVKWSGIEFEWELYFYDYARRDRKVSVTSLFHATQEALPLDPGIIIDETLPYFMFSIDFPPSSLTGNHIELVNLYLGNPGSYVSSGLSYKLTKKGREFANLYSFFNPKKHQEEITGKLESSAFGDPTRHLAQLHWQQLSECDTICIANKGSCDTIYYSGINVQQLLYFLNALDYPADLIEYLSLRRELYHHLLFDVGMDFITDSSGISLLKSGFYGIF
ncbi:MAG: hypothetical protein HOB20_11835 [Planctomycetaceae bacterium]|jgi:hypothetical protein|nr:hypothetical protein [Planctomycetaceae bacterium]